MAEIRFFLILIIPESSSINVVFPEVFSTIQVVKMPTTRERKFNPD